MLSNANCTLKKEHMLLKRKHALLAMVVEWYILMKSPYQKYKLRNLGPERSGADCAMSKSRICVVHACSQMQTAPWGKNMLLEKEAHTSCQVI